VPTAPNFNRSRRDWFMGTPQHWRAGTDFWRGKQIDYRRLRQLNQPAVMRFSEKGENTTDIAVHSGILGALLC